MIRSTLRAAAVGGDPIPGRGCVEVDVMISDESRAWLEILSVHGISSNRWMRVRSVYPLQSIIDMLRTDGGRRELATRLGRPVAAPDRRFLDRQLDCLLKPDYSVVSISDRAYPSLLREIAAPPPLLFCRGGDRRQ